MDQDKAGVLLDEGKRLLAKRRFPDAWDTLDQSLRYDKRNPETHTLLGVASLYQEYLDDAREYFTRAIELDRDNTAALCGLSYVLMLQDQIAEATEILCDVLKINPWHRLARRRFKELKTVKSVEAWVANLHPSMFVELPRGKSSFQLPPWLASRLARRTALAITFLCLAILTFTCVTNKWFFLPRSIAGEGGGVPDNRYFPKNQLLNTELGSQLERSQKAVGEILFLSDGEVSGILTRAKSLILTQDYNEARYLINRLLNSNADGPSLSLATNLAGFIKPPQATSLRFNPEIPAILEEGQNFRGVYIKWLSQVIMQTNQYFTQISPARFHRSDDLRTRVVMVLDEARKYPAGITVEVFGEIIGVDDLSPEESVVFVQGREVKVIERDFR